MRAKFNTTCPMCGVRFEIGVSEIVMNSDFGTWIHHHCRGEVPAPEFMECWAVVKDLRGVKLRKMSMHLDIKVTEGRKYADDMDLRYKCSVFGSKNPVNRRKFDHAYAIATGRDLVQEDSSRQTFKETEGNDYIEQAAKNAAAADKLPVIDTQQLVRDVVAKLDAPVRDLISEIIEKDVAPAMAEIAAKAAVEATRHLQRVKHEVFTNGKKSGEINGLLHKQFDKLLKMVAAGVQVWIAGPAGSGKTTACHQVAQSLGLDFYFNGAIGNEFKLSGFVDAQGRVVSTAFREAWTRGGLYLFDEVDASMPAAVLAFNAALAGEWADFPGEPKPVQKHADFRCVAAANTWGYGGGTEYVGRQKMDAAFLDRFVQLEWPYDEQIELQMADGRESWCRLVQKVRQQAAERGLKVVISPRATKFGAQLLNTGFTVEEAMEACIFAKMGADTRKALGH